MNIVYIITKCWWGGKFEPIEIHKTEEKAREAAGKYISMVESYNISIFSAHLIEE